jgi:uncharacterized repeat protein (TIGR03803 family)
MNAQAPRQSFNLRGAWPLVCRVATLAAGLLLFIATESPVAHAVSEETLYNFCSQVDPKTGYCDDGAQPTGNLAQRLGNFYGTTVSGGKYNGGTVFEISGGGAETVLYNFCGARNCIDGQRPTAGVIFGYGGNLYGTTEYGGLYGYGTAFELMNQGGAREPP